MGFFDPLKERLAFMKMLSPASLRQLGNRRISELISSEATRAKKKLDDLEQRYPSAGPRELAQRLIDSKKNFASMVGGVSGVFGVVTVPADLLVMVYLQISLLAEVATLFKVNLKGEAAQKELLDLFGYANGIGPLQRASPKVLGKLVTVLLSKGGLEGLGKAVPLVAAPISAYLNNQHIQAVGDHGVRHYDGFTHAHEKTKKASGG
jgi:hypothetical protein